MRQHVRYSLYIAIVLNPLMLLSCIPQRSAGKIVDGLSRQLTISVIPQRIVPLEPSNTEILFAFCLGNKIVIPEYIEQHEIEKIARFIGQVDEDILYRIDAYLPAGDNPWRQPTGDKTKAAVTTAKRYLNNVSYLTGNEQPKYKVTRIF